MSNRFNDEASKVEQPALDQLIKLGWSYVPGAQLAPLKLASIDAPGERAYLRDVVLVQRLEQALRKLNPWINEENLRKVLRELTHPNHAALMEYNHAIYDMLVNYLSVEQDLGKGRKGQTVWWYTSCAICCTMTTRLSSGAKCSGFCRIISVAATGSGTTRKPWPVFSVKEPSLQTNESLTRQGHHLIVPASVRL